MLPLHKGQHLFPQLLKAAFFHLHHGTDARYTEDLCQGPDHLIIVVVRLGIDVDAALLLLNGKGALHLLQMQPDLLHKGVLKDIAVLSLGSDLRIFDQKTLVFHVSSAPSGMFPILFETFFPFLPNWEHLSRLSFSNPAVCSISGYPWDASCDPPDGR